MCQSMTLDCGAWPSPSRALAGLGVVLGQGAGHSIISPKLLQQCAGALRWQERPAGLMPNEVGNIGDVMYDQQRKLVNNLLSGGALMMPVLQSPPCTSSGARAER